MSAQTNQKGFTVVEGLLIVVIVGVIGFVGWFVVRQRNHSSQSNAQSVTTLPAKSDTSGYDDCVKNQGTVKDTIPKICTKDGKEYTDAYDSTAIKQASEQSDVDISTGSDANSNKDNEEPQRTIPYWAPPAPSPPLQLTYKSTHTYVETDTRYTGGVLAAFQQYAPECLTNNAFDKSKFDPTTLTISETSWFGIFMQTDIGCKDNNINKVLFTTYTSLVNLKPFAAAKDYFRCSDILPAKVSVFTVEQCKDDKGKVITNPNS